MNKKGIIEPISMIMGIVIITGGILIMLNQLNIGFLFVAIAVLIESLTKIKKTMRLPAKRQDL
ncbi:MAG: hypothetical protein AABX11_06925 [Nanoarchaeota archaeon]